MSVNILINDLDCTKFLRKSCSEFDCILNGTFDQYKGLLSYLHQNNSNKGSLHLLEPLWDSMSVSEKHFLHCLKNYYKINLIKQKDLVPNAYCEIICNEVFKHTPWVDPEAVYRAIDWEGYVYEFIDEPDLTISDLTISGWVSPMNHVVNCIGHYAGSIDTMKYWTYSLQKRGENEDT